MLPSSPHPEPERATADLSAPDEPEFQDAFQFPAEPAALAPLLRALASPRTAPRGAALPVFSNAPRPDASTPVSNDDKKKVRKQLDKKTGREEPDFEDMVIGFVVAFICLLASAVFGVASFCVRMAGGPFDVAPVIPIASASRQSTAHTSPPVQETSEPPKSNSSATTISSDSSWSDGGPVTEASDDEREVQSSSSAESTPPVVALLMKRSASAPSTMKYGTHECVLLMTSTATMQQRADVGRARDILNELGVSFYEVNAAYAPRALVNRYKAVSGLYGAYPQLFVVKRQDEQSADGKDMKSIPADEDSIVFVSFQKLEEMAFNGRFEMPEFDNTPRASTAPITTLIDDAL